MFIKNSKTEVQKQIHEFFLNINDKTGEELKGVKRLAMKFKIPLKEKRRLFCKKCLMPYKTPKIRIKKNVKSVVCENCGYVSRLKI